MDQLSRSVAEQRLTDKMKGYNEKPLTASQRIDFKEQQSDQE